MKKQKDYTWLAFLIVLAICVLAASCAGVKKDCQGRKHYKTSGGFYI